MNRSTHWLAVVLVGVFVVAAMAQQDGEQSAVVNPASDRMTELMSRMKENPYAGANSEAVGQANEDGEAPAGPIIQPNADPRVVGPAPDQPQPKLRREGEFVVSRKGRLVREGAGAVSMFVFDADSADKADPPISLVPCQMLQTMEDVAAERGDDVVFTVSGQVLTYRGANYLLPTMMKAAIDRGNLK